MGKTNRDEKIFLLEDRYCLHNTWTLVTCRIQKYFYHGPRVSLTFVEGYYKSSKEMDKAIDSRGKNHSFPDYPRHFEIICRPEDIDQLAKALTEICTPYRVDYR
jgi:hypothetical protein